MNKKRQERSKNWEHSRYKDWRPSYREQEEETPGRRRRRERDSRPRRRRSFLGWLVRFCISIAIILALFGPGGDYVNGLAKAAEGDCSVRVVVDGDTILTTCPQGRSLPGEIAGYDAPELLRPGCVAEFSGALMASLDIRKALYGAETILLIPVGQSGPVAAPEPELPPADGTGETSTDAEAEPEAPSSPAAVPGATANAVRVLIDGVDLSTVMLASGRVKPANGAGGWCE